MFALNFLVWLKDINASVHLPIKAENNIVEKDQAGGNFGFAGVR